MKPQLTGTEELRSVPEPVAALSLQEELVAAIHGAFEVAVQIAVREVKKLVGQTAGDLYEEMRRENESLRRRLRRAEAMVDSARMKGRAGSLSPSKQHVDADAHSCGRIAGDAPSASHSCAQQPADPQHERANGTEEQRPGDDVKTHLTSDAEEERHNGCANEDTEESSHVCVVKVESINQLCENPSDGDHHAATLPSTDDTCTLHQVTVKQEKDGSVCCFDSIKLEDFGLESASAVQSKMLEEWEPEVTDTPSQDAHTQLSCTRLAQGKEEHANRPNVTTGFPPPLELLSLPTEFPIFQLAEPAPIPEAPPQIYGVHVRTSRNHGRTSANLYACKFCGQTFHLPSLLRRHYGLCPQKHQQPAAGNKRTRLQLYPPGCSPFRCTECNREFNRMENLKTHLRIHTGERPYTCSVCSKCFRHSGALTRHFRIHTGEKPYICGQCGKSFRNCGGLKFHQRSHSKQLQ